MLDWHLYVQQMFQMFPTREENEVLKPGFSCEVSMTTWALKIKRHTIYADRFTLHFWGSIIGVDTNQQILTFLSLSISVSECIQWLKDMSAVKIRFVTWLYCQHNISDTLMEIRHSECLLCAVTYGSEGLKHHSGMIPSLSVPHRTASLHQGYFSPRYSSAVGWGDYWITQLFHY